MNGVFTQSGARDDRHRPVPFARDVPSLGCGGAALCLRGEYSLSSLHKNFVGFVDFLHADFDIAAGLET